MMGEYTKDMFKAELIAFCKASYNPVAIAKKTTKLFYEHQSEIDLDLWDKMLDIITMEEGPEFEMTEEEFRKFLDEM
jgi:hypothetical protein